MKIIKILNGVALFLLFLGIGLILHFEIERNFLPVERTLMPQDTTNTTLVEESPGESFDWIGLISASSGIILFFLNYIFYKRKGIKTNEETDPKEKTIESLRNHKLFTTMKELKVNDIMYIELKDEVRTELTKVIIRTQVNCYLEKLTEFVNDLPDFKNNEEFRSTCRALILHIVSCYENNLKNENVPEIIIKKFHRWHEDRINLLLSDIDNIAFTKLEETTFYEALFFLFNNIIFIIRLGITKDTLNALESLNGDLKGIYFRGRKL